MKRLMAAGALGFALACLPVLAQAASVFVTRGVNLRAGPDSGYPVVAALQPGVQVDLVGCVQGWSWCDVSVNGYRGWVYGEYIQSPYQTQQVPVMSYGGQLGVPVVVFSFTTYWNNYYRGQSWYGDRARYEHYQPRYLGPGPVYRRDDHDDYNQPRRDNAPGQNLPRNQGNGNQPHNDNPRRNDSQSNYPEHGQGQPNTQRSPQQPFHNNPGGGKLQPEAFHGAEQSHVRGQPALGRR